MKALSILHPWALLIAAGEKTIENRKWYLGHTGPMLIHAGKSKRLMTDELQEELADSLFRVAPDPFELMTFGAVIGRVDVEMCCRPMEIVNREDRCWAEGPWCIACRNAVLFAEPLPWRGQLGVFDVPDSEVAGREAARCSALLNDQDQCLNDGRVRLNYLGDPSFNHLFCRDCAEKLRQSDAGYC